MFPLMLTFLGFFSHKNRVTSLSCCFNPIVRKCIRNLVSNLQRSGNITDLRCKHSFKLLLVSLSQLKYHTPPVLQLYFCGSNYSVVWDIMFIITLLRFTRYSLNYSLLQLFLDDSRVCFKQMWIFSQLVEGELQLTNS